MWVNWGIVKKDYQLLVAVLLFLFFRFKVQPQLRGRFLHTFDDGRILRQRIGLVVRCRELHLYLQVIILQRIDKGVGVGSGPGVVVGPGVGVGSGPGSGAGSPPAGFGITDGSNSQ